MASLLVVALAAPSVRGDTRAAARTSQRDRRDDDGGGRCLAAIAAFAAGAALDLSRLSPDLTVATPAPVGRYELVSVPSTEVDSELVIGTAANGLPEPLQGLFWFDDNPVPDEVMSFGGSSWDATHRSLVVQVYGERVWTWHDDLAGRALYALVRQLELFYELRFDANLDFVEIVPLVRVGNQHVRVPESIVKFTATRIAPTAWRRDSYLGGVLVDQYVFRRIVRGDGQHEPAWNDYVRQVPGTSLVAVQVE